MQRISNNQWTKYGNKNMANKHIFQIINHKTQSVGKFFKVNVEATEGWMKWKAKITVTCQH